ncbi:MAG: PIG-L family deacetylase [Acidobacteriaceae bacterium]|nr:PIG-L family deacetylase [Acidobacteriaceae bacterium]
MSSLIVLSPHCDDAVFSIATWMQHWCAQRVQVTVANFFTRSTYAPRAVVPADLAGQEQTAVSALRKREDLRSIKRISRGIDVRACDLQDAPLRLGVPVSAVSDPFRVSMQQADVERSAAIINRLRQRTAVFIAPLGLGGHVDHLTIHRAAVLAVPSSLLAFYEDLPYATWTAEEAIVERLRAAECTVKSRMLPRVLRIPHHIRLKQRLAAGYETQIGRNEARAIANYGSKYKSGERIWIPLHSRRWNALTK